MSTTEQRPTIDHTDWLLGQLAETLDRAAKMASELAEALAKPTTAPSYYPERMGYLSELRRGDRVLFAGGWREVAGVEHRGGAVRAQFTDPDMDTLTDLGSHAIRIQRRWIADELEADALYRRDNGGL